MLSLLAALSLASAPAIDWASVDQAIKDASYAAGCDVYSLDLRRTVVEIELLTAEMEGKDTEALVAERKYLARAILRCELGKAVERNRRLFEEAYPAAKELRESGKRVP